MSFQNRIEKYWNGEARIYSQSIQEELRNFKRNAWIKLISEYTAGKANLKVLDIGTGPGFFAIIMAAMGHCVTGIDCSENMVACARENAEKEGVFAEFFQMDCHKLDFAEKSFDLILCRNLTWTLAEPIAAYHDWFRVLKNKGRLLIFDTNWNLHLMDEKMRKRYDEDQKMYMERGLGAPPQHVEVEESNDISMQLLLGRMRRPQWDLHVLADCGFFHVSAKENICDRVCDEKEKILYRSTPMFAICAEK